MNILMNNLFQHLLISYYRRVKIYIVIHKYNLILIIDNVS